MFSTLKTGYVFVALGVCLSFAPFNAGAENQAASASSAGLSNPKQIVVSGVVHKVVPEEREIYVMTAEGKKHEFYFTKDTTVTRSGVAAAGQPATFEDLKKDQKVTVVANKHGKRLDPVSVSIE